ncbi:hypothetical protein D3C87_2114230 [compost metagenome]
MQVHVVDTGFIFAELIQFPLGHVRMRDAIARPFTPPVVFTPQQIYPRVRKHIEQTFLMTG